MNSKFKWKAFDQFHVSMLNKSVTGFKTTVFNNSVFVIWNDTLRF